MQKVNTENVVIKLIKELETSNKQIQHLTKTQYNLINYLENNNKEIQILKTQNEILKKELTVINNNILSLNKCNNHNFQNNLYNVVKRKQTLLGTDTPMVFVKDPINYSSKNRNKP